MLGEVATIVLDDLLLDGSHFLQSLLLYMRKNCGRHSSDVIVLSQQTDKFAFEQVDDTPVSGFQNVYQLWLIHGVEKFYEVHRIET